MADFMLTRAHVRALTGGDVRVQAHPDGVALAFGDDRLILPAEAIDPMIVPVFMAATATIHDALALMRLDVQRTADRAESAP